MDKLSYGYSGMNSHESQKNFLDKLFGGTQSKDSEHQILAINPETITQLEIQNDQFTSQLSALEDICQILVQNLIVQVSKVFQNSRTKQYQETLSDISLS